MAVLVFLCSGACLALLVGYQLRAITGHVARDVADRAAGTCSGKSADIWSGLPQEKQVDVRLVASAESQVATSSGSVLDQHVPGLDAIFNRNCASYCSQAYG